MYGGGRLPTSAILVSRRSPSTCLQPMVWHHKARTAGVFVEVGGARGHMASQFSTIGRAAASTRSALLYLHTDTVIGLTSVEIPASAEAARIPNIRPDLHVPSLQQDCSRSHENATFHSGPLWKQGRGPMTGC